MAAKASDSYNDNFALGTDGSSIELYLDCGSGSSDVLKSFDAGIANGQWYHIAVTID